MALIYVLRKDVKGLGQLTKVGMTVRSGDDRANEYGGGGWECLKEYPVDVEDVVELKQIETRVHEQLEEFKCHEAVGFGLTEVFTCSPNIAMAVVKDIVGSEPSMEDDAQRLKEKMTKGVVSKFRKQYETAYAKLIRDGEYAGQNRFSFEYREYWQLDTHQSGILQLCDKYLHALSSSGSDDPVFRKMLETEREGALDSLKITKEVREKFDKQSKKTAALARKKEGSKRKRAKEKPQSVWPHRRRKKNGLRKRKSEDD